MNNSPFRNPGLWAAIVDLLNGVGACSDNHLVTLSEEMMSCVLDQSAISFREGPVNEARTATGSYKVPVGVIRDALAKYRDTDAPEEAREALTVPNADTSIPETRPVPMAPVAPIPVAVVNPTEPVNPTEQQPKTVEAFVGDAEPVKPQASTEGDLKVVGGKVEEETKAPPKKSK